VCEALADEAKKAVTEAIAQKVKSVINMLKPPVGGLRKALPSPPSLPSLPRPPGF
jgi:hypothetical protein